MVFSNLQHYEKDAFFALLDEYFSSRPEIFANTAGSSATAGAAAASAVHHAFASNPEATHKLVSAGLKHASSNAAASSSDQGSETGGVAGRIAAFSARNLASPPIRSGGPPPIAQKPAPPGLTSSRKWGDVDTSSPMNMLSSVYNSSARKNAAPSSMHPIPVASTPKKSVYGAPPPVRRVVEPEPQAQEEEEEDGEWAEALYDYDSQEPGDLNIRENQRVLVTERTSDDWWTGEFKGKKGLFPASYVKLL